MFIFSFKISQVLFEVDIMGPCCIEHNSKDPGSPAHLSHTCWFARLITQVGLCLITQVGLLASTRISWIACIITHKLDCLPRCTQVGCIAPLHTGLGCFEGQGSGPTDVSEAIQISLKVSDANRAERSERESLKLESRDRWQTLQRSQEHITVAAISPGSQLS